MAKEKKTRELSGAERLRILLQAGDVKAARTLALALLGDETASAEDKEEARRLRQSTELDKRALLIGAAALCLAAFVVVVYLLR